MYISENVSACQNGLTSLARGIFARFFLLLSRLSSSVMKYGTFYSHFVTMTKMNKVTLGQNFIFGPKSQCWGNWDYFIRIQEESSNTVGSSDTILSNEALRDGLFSGDHHEERQAEKTSLALKLRRLALAFGLFKVKTDIAYSRRRRPSFFFFLATPITYTISFMNNIQKSILLLSQLPVDAPDMNYHHFYQISDDRYLLNVHGRIEPFGGLLLGPGVTFMECKKSPAQLMGGHFCHHHFANIIRRCTESPESSTLPTFSYCKPG